MGLFCKTEVRVYSRYYRDILESKSLGLKYLEFSYVMQYNEIKNLVSIDWRKQSKLKSMT